MNPGNRLFIMFILFDVLNHIDIDKQILPIKSLEMEIKIKLHFHLLRYYLNIRIDFS